MNNLILLLKKDLLSYKRAFFKYPFISIMYFGVILTLCYVGIIPGSSPEIIMINDFILFLIIFVSILLNGLILVVSDINQGIYEQYSLMGNIKEYTIFLSKYIGNIILASTAILCIILIYNPLVIMLGGKGLHFVNFNLFIFKFLTTTLFLTSTLYINSLFMKYKNSLVTFLGIILLVSIINEGLKLISFLTIIEIYSIFGIITIILTLIVLGKLLNTEFIK